MPNIQKLDSPYANWLDTMPWDFFCTFTTRYSLTIPQARKAMERLYPRTFDYGGSTLFWCAEPFDTKCGYHIHGLIRLDDRSHKYHKNDFDLIKESWRVVSKARIEKYTCIDYDGVVEGQEYDNATVLRRYNRKIGASGYVSKYITKYRATYDIYTTN